MDSAPSLLDCWRAGDQGCFRSVARSGSAAADVNGRDALGRTVLHLIASSDRPAAASCLRQLLSHPQLDANAQDTESGWTALHRALYGGHVLSARALLRLPATDARIRDADGLAAFDLYNHTMPSAAPPCHPSRTELLVFGANHAATLGLPDAAQSIWPHSVVLPAGAMRDGEDAEDGSSVASDSSSEDDDEHHEAIHAKTPLRSRMPGARFCPPSVREVAMARMHTVILTDQPGPNVWIAGTGTLGRLGRYQLARRDKTEQDPRVPVANNISGTPTVRTWARLADFDHHAHAVAVGPDHTLLLSHGQVWSFGSNKFGVLGYTLDRGQGMVLSSAPSTASLPSAKDLPDVQVTPRQVLGPLKREHVRGVAASRLHSLAWTDTAVYTWGSHAGQLGYERPVSGTPSASAAPTLTRPSPGRPTNPAFAAAVQVLPRKVSGIAVPEGQRIVHAAVSDFASCILISSGEVMLLRNDTVSKLAWPSPPLPLASRHKSAFSTPTERRIRIAHLCRAASGVQDLSAIDEEGNVYLIPLDRIPGAADMPVRPKRVWVARTAGMAATSVTTLPEGGLLLSTARGSVYVRTGAKPTVPLPIPEGADQGRPSSLVLLPTLFRAVKVWANTSGGMAVLTAPYAPEEATEPPPGPSVEEHMLNLLPLHRAPRKILGVHSAPAEGKVDQPADAPAAQDDEEEPAVDATEAVLDRYVQLAIQLGEMARRWDQVALDTGVAVAQGAPRVALPKGCDAMICVPSPGTAGRYLPVHRFILSARLPQSSLRPLPSNVDAQRGAPVGALDLPAVDWATATWLVYYLYTDDLPPIWSASISLRLPPELDVDAGRLRSQLHKLATTLHLPDLAEATASSAPQAPRPCLKSDLARAHNLLVRRVENAPSSGEYDVRLILADRTIAAHACILSRSPFFAGTLQPAFSAQRWDKGVLTVDLSWLAWRTARVLLTFLYTDPEPGWEVLSLLDEADQPGAGPAASEAVSVVSPPPQEDEGDTHDAFLDRLVDVLAVADWFLLPRLAHATSLILREHINLSTVTSLLNDAVTFHAPLLVSACVEMMAAQLEPLLCTGALHDLEPGLLSLVEEKVQDLQAGHLGRKRLQAMVDAAVARNWEWIETLDIPPPSLHPVARAMKDRPLPKGWKLRPPMHIVSPPHLVATSRPTSNASTPHPASKPQPAPGPGTRPVSKPLTPSTAGADVSMDEVFTMDEERAGGPWSRRTSRPVSPPPLSSPGPARLDRTEPASRPEPSSPSTPMDLRSIMAAEEARRRAQVQAAHAAQAAQAAQAAPKPSPQSAPKLVPAAGGGVRTTPRSSGAANWARGGSHGAPSGDKWARPSGSGSGTPIPVPVSTPQRGGTSSSPADAWPVLSTPSGSAPGSAGKRKPLSLHEIRVEQAQQQPKVEKTLSFAEIQAEEERARRELEQVREFEEQEAQRLAFEAWFEQESRRVQREHQQAQVGSPPQPGPAPRSTPKGKGKKKPATGGNRSGSTSGAGGSGPGESSGPAGGPGARSKDRGKKDGSQKDGSKKDGSKKDGNKKEKPRAPKQEARRKEATPPAPSAARLNPTAATFTPSASAPRGGTM